MKPKGSIIKRKKGKKVTWWARVIYTDPETGKIRDLQRRAESKTNAGDLRDSLLRDIKKTAGRSVGSEQKTFADLCDYFEKHYVIEAEYVDGRKVAGVRSLATAKGQLAALRDHFGHRQLCSITYGMIRHFRTARLKQKTRSKTQRSIASVHRELSMLRRMLNVALAEGWILENPFKAGDPLISIADEKSRERILTRDEEKRLLAACETPQRAHLRPLIIAALDTGCRFGELIKLRWEDVDFESGELRFIGFNTKNAKPFELSMTTRLRIELERLKANAPDNPRLKVFGIQSNVKRSFTAARKEVNLLDVRFHDLRHTVGSRMDQMGFTLAQIAMQLNHTQLQTTKRYVNRDKSGRMKVALALDSFNDAVETTEITELVN